MMSLDTVKSSDSVKSTHFSFEMYSNGGEVQSGAPTMDRVSISVQGNDLPYTELLAVFQRFLVACGYKLPGDLTTISHNLKSELKRGF